MQVLNREHGKDSYSVTWYLWIDKDIHTFWHLYFFLLHNDLLKKKKKKKPSPPPAQKNLNVKPWKRIYNGPLSFQHLIQTPHCFKHFHHVNVVQLNGDLIALVFKMNFFDGKSPLPIIFKIDQPDIP
jgi:hypothetical protein